MADFTENTLRLPFAEPFSYKHPLSQMELQHGDLYFDITNTRIEVCQGQERIKAQYVSIFVCRNFLLLTNHILSKLKIRVTTVKFTILMGIIYLFFCAVSSKKKKRMREDIG